MQLMRCSRAEKQKSKSKAWPQAMQGPKYFSLVGRPGRQQAQQAQQAGLGRVWTPWILGEKKKRGARPRSRAKAKSKVAGKWNAMFRGGQQRTRRLSLLASDWLILKRLRGVSDESDSENGEWQNGKRASTKGAAWTIRNTALGQVEECRLPGRLAPWAAGHLYRAASQAQP